MAACDSPLESDESSLAHDRRADPDQHFPQGGQRPALDLVRQRSRIGAWGRCHQPRVARPHEIRKLQGVLLRDVHEVAQPVDQGCGKRCGRERRRGRAPNPVGSVLFAVRGVDVAPAELVLVMGPRTERQFVVAVVQLAGVERITGRIVGPLRAEAARRRCSSHPRRRNPPRPSACGRLETRSSERYNSSPPCSCVRFDSTN